jgi:PKD repeat protein
MTKTDYITVSANPVPYVQFSVSDTTTCIFTPVTFTDLSLYNPTSWNWDFTPQSFMFVNGTTQSSQNPEVQFLTPGSYDVILSATNANGNFSKTYEGFMALEGMSLPFEEDFENATSTTLELSANSKAIIKVDKRSAFEGNYGLHFTGGGSLSGWVGSPTATTPEQAWDINVDFQASASVCNVDATQVDGIYLFVKMRQTFSLGNKLSWFRVLANGTQIPDVEGNLNFNPVTNADPFVTRQFNLADYANSAFSLTLQSSCRLVDYFYAQGDNVFIDNIGIYGSLVGVDEWVELPFEIVTAYPNPANDVLNINYLSNKAGQIEISLTNATGQQVLNQISDVQAGNFIQTINTSRFVSGVYFLSIKSDKGTTTKKIIIN